MRSTSPRPSRRSTRKVTLEGSHLRRLAISARQLLFFVQLPEHVGQRLGEVGSASKGWIVSCVVWKAA